jgi:DNA-binding Lrp family transcriptional regulator
MTDAYVMLNCELGAEEEIIEQLKEIEQVVDVFETIGTHDMLVKLQAENFEKIREIVSWNIQKLKKVRSTATLSPFYCHFDKKR